MAFKKSLRNSKEAQELAKQLDDMGTTRQVDGEKAAFVDLIRIIIDVNNDIETTPELSLAFANNYVTDLRERLAAAAVAAEDEAALDRRLRDRYVSRAEAWLDDKPLPPVPAVLCSAPADSGASMARKVLAAAVDVPLAEGADGTDDASGKKATPQALPSANPAVWAVAVEQPPGLLKLGTLLESRVHAILDVVKRIRIYAQLQMPAAQDGNNFGAEVLSDIVQQLGALQDMCGTLISESANVFSTRAAMVSNIASTPLNKDFSESLVQIDAREYNRYHARFREVLALLITLHNLLEKNWARITKPRSESAPMQMY